MSAGQRRVAAWRRGIAGMALAAAVAVAGMATPVAAQERVSFPSLDGGASPVVLTGLWFPAHAGPADPASPAPAPLPAVALFHGCGGAFDRRGDLGKRMREYAALFNKVGFGVLIVDSLGPRY